MSAPAPRRSTSIERRAELDDSLLANVQSFFKKAAVVLAVWVTGYYKFSPSWLLLVLFLYMWKERHAAARRQWIASSQEIARDEKAAILARVGELPSWVYFPDIERAEWINKMVRQMWPYISDYAVKLLRETVEPQVRASLPATMNSFRFTKIDLGDIPPRIGGVKVYTGSGKRDEIYMDLEINYASDCNLAIQIKGMSAGIKDFTLRGMMRVIFRPLISRMPLIGGMNVFFLNNPDIDFNLTNLANALDLPGLSDVLHSIVREQVANLMVLPNRIPIQIASDIDVRKLNFPLPQGVVRIHVIEAKELIKADLSILGQGKSDPYCILTVGAQECKTAVVDNTLQPVWNEVFEFIVDEYDGQFLSINVFDKDPGNKDDPIGNAKIDISTIFEKGVVDEWFTLEDVKSGMIHVKATWLYLANDPLELDRQVESVVAQVREAGFADDMVHTGLLTVNLDSAFGLPRFKKTLVEPSPMAYLTVGQNTQETSARTSTTEPKWEETFRFLVANPYHQNLDLEIRDTKTKKTIGQTSVRLKDLLSAEDMFLEQRFPLKNSDPGSCVYMTVILRVLTPEPNPQWMSSQMPKMNDGAGTSQGEESSVDKPAVPASVPGGDSKPTPAEAATPGNAGKQNGEKPLSKEEVVKLASAPPGAETEMRQRKTAAACQSIEGGGAFGLGRIQLTLRYSIQRQRLVVVIHKIGNLKPAQGDSKGLADPYVRMYLLPDRDTKSKRKTEVIKDNLNPIFDETFEYTVNPPELNNRSLELTVKNDTGIFSSSQTHMGMVLIDLSTLDTSRAVTQWFDLAPESAIKPSSLESEV